MNTRLMLFCWVTCILLLASDSAITNMQARCMHQTVSIEELEIAGSKFTKPSVAVKADINAICEWQGVDCDETQCISAIAWVSRPFFVKSLNWLPPTLQSLKIFGNRQEEKTLCTRHLPPRLTHCLLVSCGITGSIDLCTLPEGLEELNLNSNELSGDVYIQNLPRTIQNIELANNPIANVYVRNASLPPSLENVQIHWLVRPIKVISTDGEEVDTRIRNKPLEFNYIY